MQVSPVSQAAAMPARRAPSVRRSLRRQRALHRVELGGTGAEQRADAIDAVIEAMVGDQPSGEVQCLAGTIEGV